MDCTLELEHASRTRDSAYYFKDGDTILCVSGTLFKLHRCMLARDSSTFKEMFMTPLSHTESGDVFEQDGRDDEHPIVLQGDTADEFRALLWAMYALPQEIATATIGEDEDILKLCRVAKMGDKYSFQTTSSWAIEALHSYITGHHHVEIPMDTLAKVTEVALLCGDVAARLLDILRMRWKMFIGKKKNLALLITYMGQLGQPDLEGCAYHTLMLEGRDVWDADPLLTRDQHIRLLSGYYNLSRYGRVLHHSAPELTHDPACTNHVICASHWSRLWETINERTESGIGMQTLPHHKNDLIGRLTMAVSVMISFTQRTTSLLEDHTFASSSCRSAALDATMAMHNDLSRNIMVFFTDIPSSASV